MDAWASARAALRPERRRVTAQRTGTSAQPGPALRGVGATAGRGSDTVGSPRGRSQVSELPWRQSVA